MRWPEPWKIVFTLKTFAAAMLAIYVAMWLDLPRPYWALTTAYVVSQTFSASSQSKGIFRLGGTLTGAAVAIACASLFGSSQLAMLLALVGWLSFCGYFALLDRTPRNYFFLLAGLTAVLVGWPGGSVELVFGTALARSEEIGLGIICSVLVHSIIFPRAIKPIIESGLEKWAADAKALILDTLRGKVGLVHQDRRTLAADATQVGTLAVHLEYDSAENREAARWIEVLQQRMLMLLPVTASIEDRLKELRRTGHPLPGLDPLLEDLGAWVEADGPPDAAAKLRQAIDELAPKPGAGSSWHDVLLIGLTGRLRDLMSIIRDSWDLRLHLSNTRGAASARLRRLARQTVWAPHRDPGMAIWSIAAALLSGGVAAAIWYLTGWPEGSAAAQIALLMCLFFGSIDDSRPALRTLLWVLCLSIVMDGLYLFIILPRIEDFWLLALVLAPVFIPLGLLGANPATVMMGLMPIAMLTVTETATPNIAPFLDGLIATIGGVFIALVVTGLVRAIGARTSARRILHAGWRDLEAIATWRVSRDRAAFTSRMLDRLGLLAPRLAVLPDGDEILSTNALADLRLGLNMIELQRRRGELRGTAASGVRELLRELGRYFHRLGRRGVAPPDRAVLEQLDDVVTSVVEMPALRHQRSILLALSGIRQSLFPDAAPYQPAIVPESGEVQLRRLAAE
jgi:uncharacterized membrane protein YccC